MKRTYPGNTPNTPTTQNGTTYYHQQPSQPAPPLPPGPPPPPPPVGTTYGNGYTSFTQPPPAAGGVAAHPQYPGYGYGQPAAAAAAAPPAGGYPAYPQQPPAPGNPYGYPQSAPAPAAAYPGYPPQPPPQAPAPYAYPPAQPAGYPPAAPSPYGSAAGPPPPQQNPYGYGAPPPPAPQTQAPPYKRTRYDAMGGNSPQYPQSGYGGPPPPLPGGPPPALPPIGGSSRGGRGGSYAGPPSSRGAYGGASPTQSHASYGGGRGGYGGPPGPYRDERDRDPRGEYRDYPREREYDYPPPRDYRDRERDFPRDGPYRDDRPPFPRERDGPAGRGGFGPGGRGGAARGGRGGGHVGGPGRDTRPLPKSAPAPVDAPKGPRNARPVGAPTGPGGMSATNAAGAKKGERKWGNEADRKREPGGVESKKTLTDFRIEALEIGEVEWRWTGEVKRKREETAEGNVKAEEVEVKEERAAERATSPPAAEDDQAGDMSVVEAGAAKEEADGGDEHDLGDMSIDALGLDHLDDAFGSDPAQPTQPTDESNTAAPVDATSATDTPATDTAPAAAPEPSAAADTTAAPAEQSIESSTEPTPAADEDDAPKKPLSKKQKRKEAAARRASLAAEAAAEGSTQSTDTPATTAKHGREGSGEGGDEGHGAKKPKVGKEKKLDLALPAKPQGIPTGPKNPGKVQTRKEDEKEAKENSRLRIYFSSPVEGQAAAKVVKVAKKEADQAKSSEVPAEAEAVAAAEPPKEAEVATDAAKTEDPVDGEVVEDVDGEDVDGEAVDGEEVDVDGEPVEVEAAVDAGAAEGEATLVPKPSPSTEAPEVDGPPSEAAPAGDTAVTESVKAQDAIEQSADQGGTALAAGEPPKVEQPPASAAPLASAAPVNPSSELEAVEVSASLPSADRISISYARNTRRIVVDAAVASVVRIHRAEGKIEVIVDLAPALLDDGTSVDPFRVCKGVLVERLSSEGGDDWVAVGRDQLGAREEGAEGDGLLPPLGSLLAAQLATEDQADSGLKLDSFVKDQITITALLDKVNPLTEARWVKTGDADGWIVSLGISSGVSVKNLNKDERKLSDWKGKITVVDPDQPPTLQQALDSWASGSNLGSPNARQTFVSSHLSSLDNLFEILLRLTRSPTPHSSSNSAAQAPAVGALAASLSSPYPEHQTQVSLAVLAMLRLSLKTADKAEASGAGGLRDEVEAEVREVLRGIPWHLSFKALDGMFKEWNNKGGKGRK